jgi:hypothetical protein
MIGQIVDFGSKIWQVKKRFLNMADRFFLFNQHFCDNFILICSESCCYIFTMFFQQLSPLNMLKSQICHMMKPAIFWIPIVLHIIFLSFSTLGHKTHAKFHFLTLRLGFDKIENISSWFFSLKMELWNPLKISLQYLKNVMLFPWKWIWWTMNFLLKWNHAKIFFIFCLRNMMNNEKVIITWRKTAFFLKSYI